jgi:hypothetical protein
LTKKKQLLQVEQTLDAEKCPIPVETKKVSPIINLKEAEQVRVLCVLLVIEAVVSYRSAPRILELFKSKTAFIGQWIPHFTSVINWSLRLGLGLLNQVKPINQPWVAIMDHSIDIGTKKALVVLRVTVEALSHRGTAICLEDCECIGLTVSDKVTGETIYPELDAIFARSGNPIAIIKDADATLQKGARLWSDQQEIPIPTLDDIGHTLATALKAQFEKLNAYKRFTALLNYGAQCLRQTELAFLMPPKLRTKGRFQSISKLGQWGEKMLKVFAVKGVAEKGSVLEKLRKALPHFCQSREFIVRFAFTTHIVSQIMEILKNKGLDKGKYKQ